MKKFGFTLLEVLMVIIIMGVLSGIAYRSMDSINEAAKYAETQDELQKIKIAVFGNPVLTSGGKRSDLGYYGDTGFMPFNKSGKPMWNVISSYAGVSPEDILKYDAWGNEYVFDNASGGSSNNPVIVYSSHDKSNLQEIIVPQAAMIAGNNIQGKVSDWYGSIPESNDLKNITIKAVNQKTGLTYQINPESDGTYLIKNVKSGFYKVSCTHSDHSTETVSHIMTLAPGETGYADFRFNFTLPGTTPPNPGGGGEGSIEFVNNSARTVSNWFRGQGVEFKIQNKGENDVVLTSSSASYSPAVYSGSPIYYKYVEYEGSILYGNLFGTINNGDMVTWSTGKTIRKGHKAAIVLWGFATSSYSINMRGAAFTVRLSDGSEIEFKVP